MASDRQPIEGPLPLGLLEAGDPAFVDAIRAVDDAQALADFAGPWFDDPRPASRRLLLDYLERPLNAYRHEGLIKRVFKRAEAAGDDPAMARLLVTLDRSIRRARRHRWRYENRQVDKPEEASALAEAWLGLGYFLANVYALYNGRHGVHGRRQEESIIHPRGTSMPRGRMVKDGNGRPTPDWAVRLRLDYHGTFKKADLHQLPDVLERLKRFRLFSVATRAYLRRRAWRYFRKLGKTHPDRYIKAVTEALALYRDEDVVDDLALLDNWGLVHILFHRSPVLVADRAGWAVAPGRSMAELAPAPIFEPLWASATREVASLLARARCRTVVRWAVRRLEGDPSRARAAYPLEGWLELLGHEDPEVAGLASSVLLLDEGLGTIGADRWLTLLGSSNPAALGFVSDLARRFVRPEEVPLEEALRLAKARPLPLARLGFSWLRARPPRAGEPDPIFLGLIDAECVPIRPEILGWLRSTRAPTEGSILAFLDSRHADARREGLAWFRSVPTVRDDAEAWRKLLESPHDDVRLALVADLEARLAGDGPSGVARSIDPDSLLGLWAAVLLNVHRGSRARPSVVGQVLRRLEASPVDAPSLLPLLGLALRSVRGPDRRAGLVAIVKLVGRRPEVEPLVRSAFPELQWA